MKNLFKKTLCLLLVTVMMIVPISATDIIAPLTLGGSDVVHPCSGCMIRLWVSNLEWVEVWSTDGTYLYDTYLSPSTYTPYRAETYVNGHAHTGTLTSYTGVDPGTYYGTFPIEGSTSRVEKRYSGASAQFYGYLTCVPNDYK